MSLMPGPAVNTTVSFLLYDITTAPEIFGHFSDDAAVSIQFLKAASKDSNDSCAERVLAMDDNVTRGTAPVLVSAFITSTKAPLVEFGTEQM